MSGIVAKVLPLFHHLNIYAKVAKYNHNGETWTVAL